MCEGVQSEVWNTNTFDENSDLTITYLGRLDMTRASKIKAEEKFPISEQGYMIEKLLDGMECQMHLDTGTSKSFMSKSHYLSCKSLHLLSKFAFQNSKDSSRKWTIYQCVIYHTNSDRNTWSQIWNIYSSIRDMWKCRFSPRYQEQIWAMEYNKFTRVMF